MIRDLRRRLFSLARGCTRDEATTLGLDASARSPSAAHEIDVHSNRDRVRFRDKRFTRGAAASGGSRLIQLEHGDRHVRRGAGVAGVLQPNGRTRWAELRPQPRDRAAAQRSYWQLGKRELRLVGAGNKRRPPATRDRARVGQRPRVTSIPSTHRRVRAGSKSRSLGRPPSYRPSHVTSLRHLPCVLAQRAGPRFPVVSRRRGRIAPNGTCARWQA